MIVVKSEAENKVGKDLIEEIISPEIEKFNERFRQLADSSLTGMEKEVLKVYLYQKLTNQL